MRLLVLLGHDPRLDSVKDHVIDDYTITQVNGSLHTEDAKYFQLDGRQIVQQVVDLLILTR